MEKPKETASGRIVVEVDPGLKRALKAKLALAGMTLKEWIEGEARKLLKTKGT